MKKILLVLAIVFGTISVGAMVPSVEAYHNNFADAYNNGFNDGFIDGQNGSQVYIPEEYLGDRSYVTGYQNGYKVGFRNYIENLKQEIQYEYY